MLIEECPECGNYTTINDGHDDDYVVAERCEGCRQRERNDAFDAGFAEYERDLLAVCSGDTEEGDDR